MIKGLHHAAFRCKNSEQTREFYEDFLGLNLAGALKIDKTQTARRAEVLHTFYQLGDKSYIAFFEAPDQKFEFKKQHDFDLHLALEVSKSKLIEMFEKGKKSKYETRGISDHNFISSIYFRDPNGYVLELTAKEDNHDLHLKSNNPEAKRIIESWNKEKK